MEGAVIVQFVPLTAYEKCHRRTCFQRYFEALLSLLDPDLEEASARLKSEAEAAPTRRQLRIIIELGGAGVAMAADLLHIFERPFSSAVYEVARIECAE